MNPPDRAATSPAVATVAAEVLPYARDTWERIVRDARRGAWKQGLIAAYAGFVATLFVGLVLTSLASGTPLGMPAAFVLLASLFVVPGSLAALTYVGAYRLTVDQRCRDGSICAKCGYDVRASEARCPECGKPFQLNRTTPPPA